MGLSAVIRSSTSWQRSRFIGYSTCSNIDCPSHTRSWGRLLAIQNLIVIPSREALAVPLYGQRRYRGEYFGRGLILARGLTCRDRDFDDSPIRERYWFFQPKDAPFIYGLDSSCHRPSSTKHCNCIAQSSEGLNSGRSTGVARKAKCPRAGSSPPQSACRCEASAELARSCHS